MSLLIPPSGNQYHRDTASQRSLALAGISALGTLGTMPFTRSRARRLRSTRRAAMTIRRAGRRYLHRRRLRGRPRTSGRGVTTEHDRQAIYRKSRMPRGRRVRWKSFKRKVNAVAEKELGSRTVVFNKEFTFTNNTATRQGAAHCALYGLKSTTSWYDDISQVAALENVGADPTTAAGITVEKSTKIIFQSAVLDITMRNTTDFNNEQLNGEGTLEVDVYEMTMKRPATDGSVGWGSINSLYDGTYPDVKRPGGAGTPLMDTTNALFYRGVTPFDFTYSTSRYGIRIWKKTKYFIRSGQTATYQYRDPRRRVISVEAAAEGLGFNKPGWTRILLIMFKVVPAITLGANPNTRERLAVGMTRKYLYKVEGANDVRSEWKNS